MVAIFLVPLVFVFNVVLATGFAATLRFVAVFAAGLDAAAFLAAGFAAVSGLAAGATGFWVSAVTRACSAVAFSTIAASEAGSTEMLVAEAAAA
ncbi:hypothetical protein [Parasphingorhabdus sp.]|uniref:hypothetical protein n=1 Tax=Parasphingorhabdus sp. TaxID=2709688 RepID=UPI0030B6AFD0